MRALTGIVAVDVIEWIALAALLAVAARRQPRVVQIVAALSLLAAVFVTGDSPLAVFVAGAAAAGIAVVVFSDPKARRLGLGALAVALVFLAPAALVALTSRDDAQRVQDRLASLRSDLTADDPTQASRNLGQAAADIDRLRRRVGGPITAPARLIPFVSQQITATRDLTGAVREVVATAQETVADISVHDLQVSGGRIPVARIAALETPARRLALASREARRVARDVRRRPLVPQLRHLAVRADHEADDAARSAALIARLAANAPSLFGADTPRRYFLLVQNPAEARASGGILGAYAEITVTDGRLELTRVGRDTDLNNLSGDRQRAQVPGFERQQQLQPKRYWQNFTSSPDFPTVAKVIEAEYAPIANRLDGVISVDPAALAALLRIAGPVKVAHWPEPLTADNVVPILEHDQYVQFQNDFDLRELFMAEATGAIWKHVTTASLSLDRVDALAEAVAGGHILLHAAHPEQQSLFEQAGLAGGFPQPAGDVLAVTTQNASGNKVDWFLDRSVTYEPTIAGNTITAKVTVHLKNRAPSSGEPPYVIGYLAAKEPMGENRTFLSVYSPWQLTSAAVTGDSAATVLSDFELGLNAYSAELQLPPGGQATVTLTLQGTWTGGADAYRLTYRPQVLVNPETFELHSGSVALRRATQRRAGTSAALKTYVAVH